MSRLIIAFTLLTLVNSSCMKSCNYEILFGSDGLVDRGMVYLYSLEEEKVIDSLDLSAGKCRFNGKVAFPQEFSIILDMDEVRRQSDYFWVGNGQTRIAYSEYPDEFIIDSDSEIYTQYKELLDEEKSAIGYATGNGWDSLSFEKLSDARINFIKRNQSKVLSASVLEKLIKNGSPGRISAVEAGMIYNTLSFRVKRSEWGKRAKKSIKLHSELLPGNTAPNLKLPDVSGRIISLDESPGKYTIICFWHSGCIGSSQFHRYLAGRVTELASKHVSVVNISINKNRESWINYASEKALDEIGLNLWAPEGRSSIAAMSYGVNPTPLIILIDSSRRIISTGYDIIGSLERIKRTQSGENKNPSWYLEDEPPGDVAKIFGGRLLRNTINIAITPDGNELFFTSDSDGNNTGDIQWMRYFDGEWTKPEQAPFNSLYIDNDIAISPDGRYAFFRSWRPFGGKSEPESVSHIWFSENKDNTWSEPQPLFFSGQHLQAGYPSPSLSGNLYFPKTDDISTGYGNIFVLKREKDYYTEMITLGNDPGNLFNEGDICVSPDESFVITSCWERPDTSSGGRSDLYITFKNDDGTWTQLINMGPEINSDLMENSPALSPDGRFLFFNRYDGKESDVYWISTIIINEIKKTAL